VANEKGVLAGRAVGIALSKKGVIQADDLKRRLGKLRAKDIRLSPLERCMSTLEPWLDEHGISRNSLLIDQDLSEVDYGEWTGKKLTVLSLKKEWRIVQKTPSKMIFPQGESLIAVQERAERALMNSVKKTKDGVAILVSHGDVIKSLIATALELELDKFQKIVIDPASISVLDYSKGKFRLLHLNDSSTNFDFLAKKTRRKATLVGGGSGHK